MAQNWNDFTFFSEHACHRPRLEALLGASFQKPLVVVYAGAGFGKTTAVSQYLAHTNYRTVWLTLAAPDNIPARFWQHMAHVFKQHRPGLGKKMERLGFPETQHMFGTFLGDLTEELYRDNQSVAFVFDDVHMISEPAVLDFLENLLFARLENSNIVLLTRSWPLFTKPTPVETRVIGTDDLRFSLEDTIACLAGMSLHPDRETAEKIHNYVAGWPIALSLVALALKRGEENAYEQVSLATTKPALYELFEREIFTQYSAVEQDLLVKLSVLDSFPRGLVQAVTGEPYRELGQLLGSNTFIRYDADAMRLYFHPLYQEFLREKLFGVPPDELEDTYRRAARWCRDNGHYYDAVNYYRQCEDYEALWDTLTRIQAGRREKSDADFFIGQIEQMPEAFTQAHPMTRIVLATMLLNNRRFEEAAGVLAEVLNVLENKPQDAETQQLLGEYHLAQGFLALGMETSGFVGHFKQAAKLLPEGSRRWDERVLLVDLGPGLSLQSNRAGAMQKRLAAFAEGVPYMAQVLHGGGKGLDKLCECEALFLTGDLKRATEPAYQAFYAAQTASQFDILGNALFVLMRIYTILGDGAQVWDVMEHVELYSAQEAARSLGIWDVIRGWFYAVTDEVERVAGWIRSPVQAGYAPVSMDRVLMIQLRCLVVAGQYTKALALANQFEEVAKSKGAVLSLLYAELGRAVAQNQLGDVEKAAAALKEAYRLAKGNRIFTPFIEYGNHARLLLERVRQSSHHGLPQDWLDETHTKATTCAKRYAYIAGLHRQEREGNQVDYALSRRETELLTNLSQGLTREEVALAMQVSPNTVKSMTKQVFAKLGAINMADAVRIAIINQLI